MRTLKIALILIIFILVAAGLVLASTAFQQTSQPEVTSFEECAERYAVMESHPRRCSTPGGEVFVEDIENELEHQDMITVSSPRPGDEATSPIVLSGEARGPWYFEANFPVMLRTADDGTVLAETAAEADGEWMTESFVPFSADISFSVNEPLEAEVVLNRANPSGLPENTAEIVIPVQLLP